MPQDPGQEPSRFPIMNLFFFFFLNRETDRDRQTGRAAVHTVRVSERPPGDSPQQCYVNAEGWR